MIDTTSINTISTNQTNRALQTIYATYKKQENRSVKSQIAEALFKLKPFINVTTYKYLSHFRYTDGGATQASIKKICELAGVSERAYYKTVKPEIERLFSEPIVITTNTSKKDKLGRRNKGCAFKILQPLWKIEQLVTKKLEEIEREQNEFMAQFLEPAQEEKNAGTDTGAVTPKRETSTESKDEEQLSIEQSNSFRENLLEKDLKSNSNIGKADFLQKPRKKYGIKREIKDVCKTAPFFGAFDEIAQYEILNRVQISVIRTNSDINEPNTQEAVKRALANCVRYYKKGNKLKDRTKFYGALFKAVENELLEVQEEQAQQEQPRQATTQTGHLFNSWIQEQEQENERERLQYVNGAFW